MIEASSEIRAQIARLAMRKDLRFVPRTPQMPCHWQPTTVLNPATGIPFSDISAWHFIAELAEKGHPLEEVELDKPPGEKGIEMKLRLSPETEEVYIKVQVKGDRIFGRSFHYSTKRSTK